MNCIWPGRQPVCPKPSPRNTKHPPNQLGPSQQTKADVNPNVTPKVNPEERQTESQPGMVQNVLNSMQQVTTYVTSGLYSMLESRLNGVLAMGGKLNAVLATGSPSHLTWCLTHCLLRREVVRTQLQTTDPLEATVLMNNVEGQILHLQSCITHFDRRFANPSPLSPIYVLKH